MNTDPERFARAKAILIRLLEQPEAQRETAIGQLCAGDHELELEVRSLLSRAAEPSSMLDRDFAGPVGDLRSALLDAQPPRRLGDYELLERLGVGGMGEVFRARQSGVIEREVAIKFIRAGLDQERVAARFAWERRSLARMDHPNIAKIFDAGADPKGRPFVVMELAEGESILRYCDEQGLDLRARLVLFLLVCRAVQHAHERGVLHRDLKPSNILVRTIDGMPSPTVIDFGIAKALDDSDTSDVTLEGQRIGTPAYMSPEQLRGDNASVDTRSDVYALGIILYQLLAGRHPFAGAGSDMEELKRRTAGALMPSSVTGDLAEWNRIAEQRGLSPRRLRRLLRGDLDTICLKALRPERDRRYASVAHLAEDLERYLDNRPVLARPDSLGYRLRKSLRRHPYWAATILAGVLLLGGGLAFLSYHARRLEVERDRALDAERVAQREQRRAQQTAALLEGIFTDADPTQGGSGELTARELLQQAQSRLQAELQDQPEQRAQLLGVIGSSLSALAHDAEAVAAFRAAIAIADSLDLRDGQAQRAMLRSKLAVALHDQSDYAQAEVVSREALALFREVEAGGGASTAVELSYLSTYLQAQGELEASMAPLEESIALGESLHGRSHADLVWARNMLGYIQFQQGYYRRAAATLAAAVADQSGNPDIPEQELANTFNNHGGICLQLGRLEDALGALSEALLRYESIYGREHPSTARALLNLGELYLVLGRLEEAAPLIEEGHAINLRVMGPTHLRTARGMPKLAYLRIEQGEHAAAERLLRESLALRLGELPTSHRLVYDARLDLCRFLVEVGRFADAREELPPLLEGLASSFHERHPQLLFARAMDDLVSGRCGQLREHVDALAQEVEPAQHDLVLARSWLDGCS